MSVLRDATECNQVLAASSLHDRAIATARTGIIIVDATAPDMPLIDVNPARERMTGYPPSAPIGRNCRMVQGPDIDPAAVAAFQRAIRGRQRSHSSTTTRMARPAGTRSPAPRFVTATAASPTTSASRATSRPGSATKRTWLGLRSRTR